MQHDDASRYDAAPVSSNIYKTDFNYHVVSKRYKSLHQPITNTHTLYVLYKALTDGHIPVVMCLTQAPSVATYLPVNKT